MYKIVIDPGKSVSFVLKDIDIGGQNQYTMCTGSLPSGHTVHWYLIYLVTENNGQILPQNCRRNRARYQGSTIEKLKFC